MRGSGALGLNAAGGNSSWSRGLALANMTQLPARPWTASRAASRTVPVSAVVEWAAEAQPPHRALLGEPPPTHRACNNRAAATGRIIREAGTFSAAGAAVDHLLIGGQHAAVTLGAASPVLLFHRFPSCFAQNAQGVLLKSETAEARLPGRASA
jgi:hypothetical protein